MDINGCAALGERVIEAEAAMRIPRLQRLEQPGARRIHRLAFQPAIGLLRIDDDDFGAIGLGQPLGDRLGDPARGEILALGIDMPLRRRDLVEVELLDLDQPVLVVHFGRRAGDGDLDILELHRQGVGPAFIFA